MRFKVEASGLKIGKNNSITESIKTGEWGVRLTFTNNESDARFEVCLKREEAVLLMKDIELSLDSINECMQHRKDD